MSLECELKFLDVDLDAVSRKLSAVGGEFLGKYFESNKVFDRPDRSLKEAGILLRLREKLGKGVLTVKKPPQETTPSMLKVFEEIETEVGDCAVLASALEVIGFREFFTYEKVREKWRFMHCVLCLDHLPFGDFIEIEGDEQSVLACAGALGLDLNNTTTSTYHALNISYRSLNGLDPMESFVFAPEEASSLQAEIEKD